MKNENRSKSWYKVVMYRKPMFDVVGIRSRLLVNVCILNGKVGENELRRTLGAGDACATLWLDSISRDYRSSMMSR